MSVHHFMTVHQAVVEIFQSAVDHQWLTSSLKLFQQKESVNVGAKMSLADRMKILKDKEEQWKSKGKGAANDSTQFTVAGRMAKRGKTIRCLFLV